MLKRIFPKEFNQVMNCNNSPLIFGESEKRRSTVIFGDPWGP